jgi:hypothetical protein
MAQSAHSRPAISTPGHTSLRHSEADRSGGRPPPEADRSDGIPIRKQTDPTAYRSEGRAGAPACPPQPNHRSPARVPRSARDPPGAEREARGASTGTPETSSMPREERRGRSAALMGHHRGHKPRTRGPAISTPGHTSLRHPEKQTAPRADRAEAGVGAPACPARAGSALRAGRRPRATGHRAPSAECGARVAGRWPPSVGRGSRGAGRAPCGARRGAPRAAVQRHRRRPEEERRGRPKTQRPSRVTADGTNHALAAPPSALPGTPASTTRKQTTPKADHSEGRPIRRQGRHTCQEDPQAAPPQPSSSRLRVPVERAARSWAVIDSGGKGGQWLTNECSSSVARRLRPGRGTSWSG